MCRSTRICRAGCGQEKTPGQADTPGFKLINEPDVKFDLRRTRKLFLPRNHPRLNQSSMPMLQSWRGNCDVQIIVCDCDPNHPSLSEIAKVTDYVVGYACKGNSTTKEERAVAKDIILR